VVELLREEKFEKNIDKTAESRILTVFGPGTLTLSSSQQAGTKEGSGSKIQIGKTQYLFAKILHFSAQEVSNPLPYCGCFFICQLPGTPPWIVLALSDQIDYIASEVLICRSRQAEGANKIL
jgi:hypothetical protein